MTALWVRVSRTLARMAGGVLVLVAAAPASAQGLAQEDASSYRGFAKAPHYRAFLPASVDLSGDFPEPADQGAQGSCTAWAVGYALRSFIDIRSGRSERRRPEQAFSPAYIYNQIKSEPNNCLEPTRISDALQFLENRGVVTMADFPYVANDCSRQPPQDLVGMATPNRMGRWQRVEYTQVDDVKGQLALGRPVVFGMMTPLPFEQLPAGKVFDQIAGPKDYGHAMVVVGYDDALQAFKVINSWGKRWADNGFGWISYNSFRENARSAFAAETALAAPPPTVVAVPPDQQQPPPPLPATPAEVAVVPPPAPVVKKVASPVAPDAFNLDERLKGLVCSSLAGKYDGGGRLRVAGYVESEDDLRWLRQRLAGLPGMGAGTLAVDIRPWPQCEALQTLAAPISAASGLTVSLRAKSGRITMIAGDQLVVRVRAPDFPSYLYVTYIQASGDAVHLVSSTAADAPTPPSATLTFGDDPRKPSFRITPPFGREMIVVVAASRPLFTDRPPTTEEEREYLSRIRQAILAGGDAQIAAATAVTVTHSAP